ncbi:MAG: class I SAM-dependent methyltransferase, partial [Candidatus Diapherotrites archaeon]|nr:class I SAM-dependent methyltransferase [Candidatus Diapherotrites archaeon]
MRPYSCKVAGNYHLLVPYDFEIAPREVRFLESFFPRSGKRVLDCACGTGRWSVLLAKDCFEVTGIDLTVEMLDVARKRSSKPRFLLRDMLSYRSNKRFDVVLCGASSIMHLHSRKKTLQALRNFHENLEPGGVLIFDVW